MSDSSQGSGWKQASDGKWYPAGPSSPAAPTTEESEPTPAVQEGNGSVFDELALALGDKSADRSTPDTTTPSAAAALTEASPPPAPEPPPPAPLPAMVPGSVSPPAPDWERGIDGNWYAPREPRSRPPAPDLQTTYQRSGFRGGGVILSALLIAALLGVIVGGVVLIRENNEATPPDIFANRHQLGDDVRIGDLNITVSRIDNPHTPVNPSEAAPPGNHLVAIELVVANARSDNDINIASADYFHLTDATGTAQVLALVSDVAVIDGAVRPDATRTGFVIFQVSDNAIRPFTLRIEGPGSSDRVSYTFS